MPLTPEQKEMAERLAELLSQSLVLDDAQKENILDNLDKLPEEDIVKLMSALEDENDQIQKIASDIEVYIAEQETGWQNVEKEQKNFANEFVEKMAQALDDRAKLDELKESL